MDEFENGKVGRDGIREAAEEVGDDVKEHIRREWRVSGAPSGPTSRLPVPETPKVEAGQPEQVLPHLHCSRQSGRPRHHRRPPCQLPRPWLLLSQPSPVRRPPHKQAQTKQKLCCRKICSSGGICALRKTISAVFAQSSKE